MSNSAKIHYYENSLNLKEVIKNFGLEESDEPFHICDLSVLKQKVKLWKSELPRVKPFYAVKCNEDPLVVKTLADMGTGFDCASKNEIEQVLELGVEPERIIFANPCKPITHLNYAREQEVANVTFDSELEICKIYEHFPQANLVLRFRSDARDAQYLLGEKFGCDPDNEAAALLLLAKSLQLKVIGCSFHIGSGRVGDFQAYDRAIASAAKIFEFGQKIGYDMNFLDIGGGFWGTNDDKFEKVAIIINKALQRHFPDEKVKVIAEPGQFFATAANTLICKIIGKRELRAADTKMYYVNDGVYGSFTHSWFNPQDVVAQHLDHDQDMNSPKYKTIIWGPTCDSRDKITQTVYLPDLSCGDFIIFPNTGSYSLAMSCTFNGFNLPRVLYFKKREA